MPIALGITAIGMTLLFLALGLFYGLLALLTAVVRDPTTAVQASAGPPPPQVALVAGDDVVGTRRRAAAIAVALARAEAEAGAWTVSGPDESDVPAAGGWWALHHGRRLSAPPSPWRGR
ncbi:MAG TPA: OadG family transporter subunit [Anaerolineae bacterium]|nr:OadG family transporter subunit [Anaerolineae bacterium]